MKPLSPLVTCPTTPPSGCRSGGSVFGFVVDGVFPAVSAGCAGFGGAAGRAHTGTAGSLGSTSDGSGVACTLPGLDCVCGWVCEYDKLANANIQRRRTPTTVLLRRCIVSRLGINIQMWQPFGRSELNFDFAPPAIFGLVVWTVSEYILVAQLYSNLRSHISQVIGIAKSE